MAKKVLNLKGTSGKDYDLDVLSTTNTRLDANEELVVQVWEWNRNALGMRSNPNPPDLEIGQIWLSKEIPLEELEEKYDLAEGE